MELAKDPLKCIKALTELRKALVELKNLPQNEDYTIYGIAWTSDFQLEDFLFVIIGEFLDSSPRILKASHY